MIFSSYPFILVFLPIVLAGVAALRVAAARLPGGGIWAVRVAMLGWIAAASLVFYVDWNPVHLPLLLGSVAANYALGRAIPHARTPARANALVALGTAIDLGVLGYFKYRAFALESVAALAGTELDLPPLVLPLAVSFFTFQQIAWLVDVRRGRVAVESPLRYLFFVSFFPQLIAGPIVHYNEIMPQVRAPGWLRLDRRLFAAGVAMFAIGLGKKVLVADAMAPAVDAVYAQAAGGGAVSTLAAWGGAVGFGLQLYFDFSAYADMALGLAAMLGLHLPINFWSPYRAGSVIGFWRRWHITLARFLRDHVYIPLGGNRRGPTRQAGNMLATMLLGGLWHGAGWTYVLWGGVHGVMLVLNHAWRGLRARLALPRPLAAALAGTGAVLAFAGIMLAWLPFRAPDIGTARRMAAAALTPGLDGVARPDVWNLVLAVPEGRPVGLAIWCILGLLAVWLLPNSHRLSARFDPEIQGTGTIAREARATARPVRGVGPLLLGTLSGFLILASLKALLVAPSKEFFYFAF